MNNELTTQMVYINHLSQPKGKKLKGNMFLERVARYSKR